MKIRRPFTWLVYSFKEKYLLSLLVLKFTYLFFKDKGKNKEAETLFSGGLEIHFYFLRVNF